MQGAQMKTVGGKSTSMASMGVPVGSGCRRYPGRIPAWPPELRLQARLGSPHLSSDSVLPSTSLPVCHSTTGQKSCGYLPGPPGQAVSLGLSLSMLSLQLLGTAGSKSLALPSPMLSSAEIYTGPLEPGH